MPRIHRTASALAILAAFAAPALAQEVDADAFGTALTEFLDKQSLEVSHDDATLDGSDVVFTNFTIGPKLPEGTEVADTDMRFTFDEVRFQGVEGAEDGGYRVASVGRQDVSGEFTNPEDEQGKNETIGYTIGEWGIENLVIPGSDETSRAALGLFYDRIFVSDMTASVDGQEVVSLGVAESAVSGEGPYEIITNVDAVSVDMTAFTGDEVKAWVEGTGYETVAGEYESSATWDTASGDLIADVNRLTLDGMGQFDLALAFGGYTQAFAKALSDASEQMQGADPQASQAASMQMLGLMAQLSFGEFTISYRDGGMADTLLTYYAETDGKTKDELVSETLVVLPAILGQIQAPELQGEIQEAVTTFLNDPQSITVSLKPDAPVPAPVLMGAAASSPAQLAQALNARVRANDLGTME